MIKAELTKAEESEFTILNVVAFDLARMKARKEKSGAILPCWLVMSEQARREARDEAFWAVKGIMGNIMASIADVESHLRSQGVTQAMVDEWKELESHYKYLRDVEKNPRAWFAS